MWNSITANDLTRGFLKENLQSSYLDREKLDQTEVSADCSSANNVKHGEMEDTFMNFAFAIAAHDSAFPEVTMTTRNMSTQLRLQEDHIQALQVEICNLKVAAATRTTKGK